MRKLLILIICLMLLSCNTSSNLQSPTITREPSKMKIIDILDNRGDYPDGKIPAYEKYEITFQIQNSIAQNNQFPYDSSPPLGIDTSSPVYQGITVNAIFTTDNWETTYQQPAFFYQDFEEDIRENREWYYPTDRFSWKVRFSPPTPGDWQFKISAEDASGYTESSSQSFAVVPSSNPGFIQVSSNDPRYFEFEDGSYFLGLGYNLRFHQIDPINPHRSNQAYFQNASQNRVQFFRYWLSDWSIYTSAWNPWHSIKPAARDGYLPFTGLTFEGKDPNISNETSMIVNNSNNPCMFIGWQSPSPSVKPDTNYRIRIRYQTFEFDGPRISGYPYGLVAKMGGEVNGGWLWEDDLHCNDPGTGIVVSEYQNTSTQNLEQPWQILEGNWYSGDTNFLPYFYLVIENANRGRALIDHVWIEPVVSDESYGMNILSKPWMSHHLYFDQRNSYAFDIVIDSAHQNDIYLKLVTLEKNEWIMNRIQFDGSNGDFGKGNKNFYGDGRSISKVRWLQQAWWRYIQARWGYSPNIHSWELINEGDPFNGQHYALADEFGKYMKCRAFGIEVESGNAKECVYEHPNSHLVTTSFWHSFPTKAFWSSDDYPNIDYADLHAYNSTGKIDNPAHEIDAALYHLDYSQTAYNMMRETAGKTNLKPIVRGEAGIDFKNQQVEQPDLSKDHNGVWLHNFLWATLDSGGMMELYWWNDNIENQPGPDGEKGLYEIFSYFDIFLSGVPLNNGFYEDIEAQSTNPNVRVIGQKDLINQKAHLWVQSRDHTWRNVVNGGGLSNPLSGSVTIKGFNPNTNMEVNWHSFTTQGTPTIDLTYIQSDENGTITLPLPNNPHITDIGIRIENTSNKE